MDWGDSMKMTQGDERAYEPPAIVELGALHELTRLQNKDFGSSDGYQFQGSDIMNVSY